MCEVLNNIEGINFICLDVANGYSQFFVEFVAKVRKTFPSHTIMVSGIIQTKSIYSIIIVPYYLYNQKIYIILPKAGNVVTGDMVEALIFAGADIIKVYDRKKLYQFVHKEKYQPDDDGILQVLI